MSTTPTPMPQDDAAQPQTAAPQAQGPGMGRRILGALSGGGQSTSYNVGDDGIMKAVQAPQPPGQMFRNLLGGMLTGLAGGIGQPGGALGAFAGGYEATQARTQQQDQLKRQQAEQNFKNQQQAKKTDTEQLEAQGHMAQSQLEMAKLHFQLANERRQLSEGEQNKTQAYMDAVKTVPGAKFDGSYTDWADFLKTRTPDEQKEVIAAKARGEVLTNNTYDEDGKVNGVQVYQIPQTYLQTPTKEDWTYVQDVADPKTGKIESKNITVPAGAMNYGQKMDVLGKNLRPLAAIQNAQGHDSAHITIEDKRDATKLQTDAADNATKLGVARINANAGTMSLTDGTTLNLNGADGQQATAAAARSLGFDAAAWAFIESGGKTLPSMGFGKQGNADKREVIARSGQLMLQYHIDPSDLGAIGANMTANRGALSKVSQQQAVMNVFEGTLDRNIKIAEGLNKKYSRTDMSFANRVIEHIKYGTGDSDVQQFVFQMKGMAPEFGKIQAGATGAAGGTDSATHDAQKMVDKNLSEGNTQAIFNLMRQDIQSRKSSGEAEIQSLLHGVRGKEQNAAVTGSSQAAQPGAPAVGFVKDGWKFKGGNPSDHANWVKQ